MTQRAQTPKLSVSKPDGHSRFILSVDGVETERYEFVHQAGYPCGLDTLNQKQYDKFAAWVESLPEEEMDIPGAGMQTMKITMDWIVHELYNSVVFEREPDLKCLTN
jgi:hypothetical protein